MESAGKRVESGATTVNGGAGAAQRAVDFAPERGKVSAIEP